jgi:sulfite reductase (NADPH) flavoprotein alpha-component
MNSPTPLIPDSAPFTPEQRAWLNGFFAGMYSRGPGGQPALTTAAPAVLTPLTIIFGSQTGTSEAIAKKAAKAAAKRGFAPTVADMGTFDASKLPAARNVLIVTSTFGDGEPPDNAKALHAALTGGKVPFLTGVRFSVCALGDTNYPHFCKCGREFDALLEKCGAVRATARVDCDLDHEAAVASWLDAALGALSPSATGTAENQEEKPAEDTGYSKKNPFPAPVLAYRPLNATGSAKEVNHFEFSLEGSNLSYETGDALGVYPQNCPDLVSDVIRTLGCDGEEAVSTSTGELPLRTALTIHYDLGRPSQALIDLLAPVTAGGAAAGKVSSAPTAIRDVLDLLLAAETKPGLTAFIATLKKIQPRLYSISSSPKAHPGQVHLTVGAVRYEANGRKRKGVCSMFLAERAMSVGKAGVFIHHNPNFRLPSDGDKPVIMVGPGTGIAPFRAFLEERHATGAKGKNWLFFGDQRSTTDFLYRDEVLAMQQEGHLSRLDLAWSRDQTEKIYVQQRMIEQAAEFYAWLEAGACLYVCGDASRMAKDVDAALHQLIELASGRTPAQAADYVQALKNAKRYQRDVY